MSEKYPKRWISGRSLALYLKGFLMNKQNKCAIGCFDFFNALSGDTISPGFFSKKNTRGNQDSRNRKLKKKISFPAFLGAKINKHFENLQNLYLKCVKIQVLQEEKLPLLFQNFLF